MDWEYQDQGPVDLSSPFAQLSRKQQPCEQKRLPKSEDCRRRLGPA